jgi:hypothetical protein
MKKYIKFYLLIFLNIFLLQSCITEVEVTEQKELDLTQVKENPPVPSPPSSPEEVAESMPAPDRTTFFISPNGSDSNHGTLINSPLKTFKQAFQTMGQGDELILLDGTYSVAGETGILRSVTYNGASIANSGPIPSGKTLHWPTIIRALNPGEVIVQDFDNSPLFIGRSNRKVSYLTISGITFYGGGQLFNSSYVTIKDCGFKGSFSVGTGDHPNGNSYNLIEDVWIWSNNRRIVAINYRSHNNVWRRVVVRSDGCDQPGCESFPKEDPSVGITVYDSHDVSMQNIIVVDRVLRNDRAYGDFATAQHTSDSQYYLGRNEWLGSMSINSDDAALHFEADSVLASGNTIWKIENFATVGSSIGGINLGNVPYNYDAVGKPISEISHSTVILDTPGSNRSSYRVSPGQSNGLIKNSIGVNGTRTNFNSISGGVENSVGFESAASEGNFDSQFCTGSCIDLSSNPTQDGSLLYPTRVETNSSVATAISNQSIGANITKQIGSAGSRFGESGYNTKSTIALWPWPNEARIKKEMCLDSEITRGFCSTSNRLNSSKGITLSSYIWESLGNQMPAHIYND